MKVMFVHVASDFNAKRKAANAIVIRKLFVRFLPLI